jgi:hypothetical protein
MSAAASSNGCWVGWPASHRRAIAACFSAAPRCGIVFDGTTGTASTKLSQLSREHGISVPAPSHVVFGHTHQPIPWGADELVDDIDGHTVRFCNTGGWLLKDDADGEFVGAEVVVYESGRGFRSHSVRSRDLAQEPALAGAR